MRTTVGFVDLKEQIARTESHMIKENRQVTYWNEYKDVGCHDHRKQIDLLERELADMQTSYDEMAGTYKQCTY